LAEGESVSTSYGDVSIPGPEAAGEGAPSAPAATQAPETPWWEQHANSELEFNAAGKNIKAPLSKVKQWAQQGYDYAQRMQAFNQEKTQFDSQRSELAKDAEWADIIKYSRENPDWANHTRESFEQRQAWRTENANNPLLKDFEALKQELEPIKRETEALRAERQRIEFAEQDKVLNAEITAVGERYSKYGMDLKQIDPETGMSFEASVLKYGSENGIKTFKTAFLELYGDKVEALRDEASKKQAAEEFAKRQQQGFIGRTSTPTQAPSKAQNVGRRSWGSLQDEALNDLKAGKY
jgi:hypothetical protein